MMTRNRLKHVLAILQAIALLLLIAVLGAVLILINALRPKAVQALTDLDRTTVIVAGAATNIEKASRAWEQASKDQSAQTTKAMQRVSAAAGGLSSFISRTDTSVNVLLFPAVTEAIRQQNAALLTSQAALQANLAEMQKATQKLQQTLVDADKVIADPNLAEASKNLADASQEAAGTLVEAHASVTDVRQVADKFRETYLKPQNVAWAILKQLIGIGGSMAQMIK